MIKAARWLTEYKNKEEATSILIKYERMTPQVGQRVYDFLVNRIQAFPKNAEITSDAIRTIVADLAKSGFIATPGQDYKKFIDLTHLELAIREIGAPN